MKEHISSATCFAQIGTKMYNFLSKFSHWLNFLKKWNAAAARERAAEDKVGDTGSKFPGWRAEKQIRVGGDAR